MTFKFRIESHFLSYPIYTTTYFFLAVIYTGGAYLSRLFGYILPASHAACAPIDVVTVIIVCGCVFGLY